jgi:hypothetical protein
MDSAQRTGISTASPHLRRELTRDEVRRELQRAFEIQSRSRAQLERIKVLASQHNVACVR